MRALSATSQPIPALVPREGAGHQFVCYADSCSGVPGAPHEAHFGAVNAVVARLSPRPQFICFPGDEIIGLTADDGSLMSQWLHWLGREMAWLDRDAIPLYHTTGNHTTYDAASEAVFREALPHLPRNGPPGQEGLTYFVRRGDLLLVFVNTSWSGLGGEGRVETAWMERTLTDHADARHKLVFGHHPVHAVNGFSGPFQRQIAPENGRALWEVLARRGVLAYVCSHILAFDVQVHEGVLQILTAGAGTAERMPEGTEYLHCVQAALDAEGLRYQVLDTSGRIREWLAWPPVLPPSTAWAAFGSGENEAPLQGRGEETVNERDDLAGARLVVWRFAGSCPGASGEAQTLLCGWDPGAALAPLWIGVRGPEHHLAVLVGPSPGSSPHHWLGPALPRDRPFEIQVAVHTGMGPGGILWRWDDAAPWSSLTASSPWGAERLVWPSRWSTGHDQRGPGSRPFQGGDLEVAWHTQFLRLRRGAGE